MIDLAALLTEPARVAEVPPDAVPHLLSEALTVRGEVAAIEQALLARLRGEVTDPDPATAPPRRRLRGHVSVHEFATLAGVKPGTVYDWIHEGRIAVKKRGSTKQARVRIALSELVRLDRERRPRMAL